MFLIPKSIFLQLWPELVQVHYCACKLYDGLIVVVGRGKESYLYHETLLHTTMRNAVSYPVHVDGISSVLFRPVCPPDMPVALSSLQLPPY